MHSVEQMHEGFVEPLELLGWRLPVRAAEAPSLKRLGEMLRQTHVNWACLKKIVSFRKDFYSRQTLYQTPACELILVGWLPGQSSAIHDHGGSYGATLIVRGSLQEHRYRRQKNVLALAGRRRAGAGCVLLEGADTIHRVANVSGRPVISLHIYLPPLSRMVEYGDIQPHNRAAAHH